MALNSEKRVAPEEGAEEPLAKGETSKKKVRLAGSILLVLLLIDKISVDLITPFGLSPSFLQAKSDSPTEDAAVAVPALESIDIGGSVPTLTLKNEKGEDIQIADLANEKGVVLFLVPKADTPGCTTQACEFRDVYPDFSLLNFDVYCLSADTSTAQAKWQTKKELPYPSLIAALGAAEDGKTKRSHFVLRKGGKLVVKKIPVKPVDRCVVIHSNSPRLALKFIKSIQEGGEAPAS
ncbi:hypothetical protein H1R20_g1311, partial [Candolleomyces eurysporus]